MNLKTLQPKSAVPAVAGAVLLLAAAFPAVAQPTNGTNFALFQVISQRNIFDPNRYPYTTQTGHRRTVSRSVPTFSLVGTMDYRRGRFAFFDGTDSDYRRVLSTNDVIAGYKIAEITLAGVRLESTNKPVELKIGAQMRLESGEWQLIESGEWTAAATTNETPTADASPTTSAGASGQSDDVLKKLMQQREQELK